MTNTPEATSRRAALANEVRLLSDLGFNAREMAEALGISRSYAAELRDDPTGLKSKQRKQRYASRCVDCGAPTSGSEGRKSTPRCGSCAARRSGLAATVWTPALIIERIQEWAAIYGEPPAIPDWGPTAARFIHDEDRARRFEEAAGHWPRFTVVFSRFGKWSDALEAAGFTARAPHGGAGNQYRRRRSRRRQRAAA